MRKTLKVILLCLSHAGVGLGAYIYSELDSQSYYATSINILVQETISALDSGESSYVTRLKVFAENQLLTYESRSNLLENTRRFHAQGEELRAKTNNWR